MILGVRTNENIIDSYEVINIHKSGRYCPHCNLLVEGSYVRLKHSYRSRGALEANLLLVKVYHVLENTSKHVK